MSLFALIYNLMLLIGLVMQFAGLYMLYGAGAALLATGLLIILLTAWAGHLTTRRSASGS